MTRRFGRFITGRRNDFDADARTFTLEWTTQRASGKGRFKPGTVTEIRVPRRQYPKGYLVEARGAKVLSKRNAPILRLAARKRARKPQVTITAAG